MKSNKYSKLIELKKHLINVIYEGSELEGLGLTYAKTSEILNNPYAKDRFTFNQISAVIGMKKAYDYIFEILENHEVISIDTLKRINYLIDSYEEPELAGKWRTRDNSIGGTYYIPPKLQPKKYELIVNEILSRQIYSSLIVKLYITITSLQFFADGNKRTALVFCNLLLVKNDLDFIKILDHHLFKRLLVNCYEARDGAEEKFISYVLQTAKFKQVVQNNINKNKSKFISVGSNVGDKIFNNLQLVAQSENLSIGRILKKYLLELSSGYVKNYHLVKNETSILEEHNSNKWIGCRLKQDEYNRLIKFCKSKNVTVYELIKGWALNMVSI